MAPRLAAAPAKVRSAPKLAEGFYQSRDWRRFAARIKRERGGYCQRCGSKDRVILDHIVERRDGGADFDEANVELLCARHHNAKTAKARAARAAGTSPRQR